MKKLEGGDFKKVIQEYRFVIIDFSAPGCAPCKKIPPLLEETLSLLDDDNVAAFEVDVVENPDIAMEHTVLGVPTLIVFKNGRELTRFNSVPKKEKLIAAIRG